MGTRAALAAAAAALRAAGASATGAGRVPVGGGRLVFDHQAASCSGVTGRAMEGGASARSFYGFVGKVKEPKGRFTGLVFNRTSSWTDAAARGCSRRSFGSLLEKGKEDPKLHPVDGNTSWDSNWKVFQLETELKFEQAISKVKLEYEEQLKAIVSKQDEFKVKISEVNTDLKLLQQQYASYKESINNTVQVLHFNVWKAAVGVAATAGGLYLSCSRIWEKTRGPSAPQAPGLDKRLV